MSGLAIFSLKFKSLLQFEKDKASEPDFIKHNLTPLYGVKHVPCDTYLRERLDGKFLISLDASGFFSSNEVHCEYCCERIHNKSTDKETITYHHQMLVGSMVSPLCKQVIPMGFEPIIKEDGSKKNDCERG